MNIDKNKLRSAADIDEGTLRELIRMVVLATGGDKSRADAMASMSPIIRRKLANATDKEINDIVSMVGEKKAQEIINLIDRGGGKGNG